MITAVLDTNVLLSGLLSEGSIPGQILQAWRAAEFQVITSQPVVAELTRVLDGRYFRARFTVQDTLDLLTELTVEAVVIELPAEVARVATHPEDDWILATAAVAQADYLVTGDKHLQALDVHHRPVIVSPRIFAEILARGGQ